MPDYDKPQVYLAATGEGAGEKIPSRTSLVPESVISDFVGARPFFSKYRPCCLKPDLTLEPLSSDWTGSEEVFDKPKEEV